MDMVSIPKIRCALVHDHVLLRQGLRRLLEDEPEMEIVAEAGNAVEALQCVYDHRPDVVIANANIFEFPAQQAEYVLRQLSPHTRALFLSTDEQDELHVNGSGSEENLAAKKTSAEQLVEMVRKIHFAQNNLKEMPRKPASEWPAQTTSSRSRGLTSREQEVLTLLAEGRTVRSTADALGLSVKTVDAHKFNLMRKLGIHNKTELVMWAIQKRLIKMPSNF